VLIEKPVCLTAGDAREVFAAARQAGVFAMEAMWMRTNPLIRTAVELIAQGEIGEVVATRAEFAWAGPFDPGHRLYDPANVAVRCSTSASTRSPSPTSSSAAPTRY